MAYLSAAPVTARFEAREDLLGAEDVLAGPEDVGRLDEKVRRAKQARC